jgi:lipoprotein NlpI
MALDFLGTLRNDKALLSDALQIYQKLLLEDGLTPDGRANMFGHIGETHRHMAEWELAKKSYVQALEFKPSAINEVFLCECLLQLQDASGTAKLLSQINSADLDEAEQVDYAFVLAALAIQLGERERLESAKSVLKSIHVKESFFRERRDAYLLNVQEAIVSGASQNLSRRTLELLASAARSATGYLILKPSFMGMGIDVGKIVEDISRKGKSKSSDDKSK